MQTTSLEETPVELDSDCATCKRFMEAYKTDTVKVGNDAGRVVLQFETDGSMSAKEVALAGMDILSRRFTDLADQVGSLA
jgi:hypothetical protein